MDNEKEQSQNYSEIELDAVLKIRDSLVLMAKSLRKLSDSMEKMAKSSKETVIVLKQIRETTNRMRHS